MQAFEEKTPEQLGQMSIPDLLKLQHSVDTDYVQKCRDYKLQIHQVICMREVQQAAMKVKAPAHLAQTFKLTPDIGTWLKSLPAEMADALREFFAKGDKK